MTGTVNDAVVAMNDLVQVFEGKKDEIDGAVAEAGQKIDQHIMDSRNDGLLKVYVDQVSGDNSNDGLSAGSAFFNLSRVHNVYSSLSRVEVVLLSDYVVGQNEQFGFLYASSFYMLDLNGFVLSFGSRLVSSGGDGYKHSNVGFNLELCSLTTYIKGGVVKYISSTETIDNELGNSFYIRNFAATFKMYATTYFAQRLVMRGVRIDVIDMNGDLIDYVDSDSLLVAGYSGLHAYDGSDVDHSVVFRDCSIRYAGSEGEVHEPLRSKHFGVVMPLIDVKHHDHSVLNNYGLG
jgi:hypothetical protein